MILQALAAYYNRKIVDPHSDIAPEGFERKEIPFIVVLDHEGHLVQIEDTRYQVGKQKRAKAFLVPQSEKRTVGIKAYLLWDNAEYVFGICVKGNFERVEKQHAEFINRIKALNLNADLGVSVLIKFLESNPSHALENSEYAIEIKEGNPFLAFRLCDETNLICERKAVIDKILSKENNANTNLALCLVTGEKDSIANLQPAIKGVRDTNSTGGNIVSFNLDAFNSFNKRQGANAPIGEKATFAYTTALNYLLSKDSKQKIQVGDATTVFWSDKISSLENTFSSMFEEPPKDNPDALTEAVKALYQSVNNGAFSNNTDTTKFFALGLAPNAARISVRFWQTGTVEEFSKNIMQHFQDFKIQHAPYEKDYLPIWQMLKSIAAQEKIENIPPNLAGDWMRAILAGLPYPTSLYQATLRRIHAERDVSYPRAAIIKAYLNRIKRSSDNQQKEEIKMALDENNCNIGYRLGRLFATLEKIQEEAHKDNETKVSNINSTIRDKYYSSASSTPKVVFPILIRLKNHHLNKIEKTRGKSTGYWQKLIGEIINNITTFPSQLNLENQGLFAIGYYHQRQSFFNKSETANSTNPGE